MPEATAGYQFSTMLYVKKPFELAAFANNAWVDQPANMLMPSLLKVCKALVIFMRLLRVPIQNIPTID